MSNDYGVSANRFLQEIVGGIHKTGNSITLNDNKASVTLEKLPTMEATTISVQIIPYIINKICFDAIFSFAVTVGNISILNYIYDLGFKLHVMAQLIKCRKCVLYIRNKILFIVLIIMIFTLISLLILTISDVIGLVCCRCSYVSRFK